MGNILNPSDLLARKPLYASSPQLSRVKELAKFGGETAGQSEVKQEASERAMVKQARPLRRIPPNCRAVQGALFPFYMLVGVGQRAGAMDPDARTAFVSQGW